MKKPFLLTLMITIIYGNIIAQVKLWSIDVAATDPLKEIVDLLSSRQNLLIAYPPTLATLAPEISGNIKANSLEELLSQIYPGRFQIKKLDDHKYLIRDKDLVVSNYEGASEILQGQILDQAKHGIADVLIYQDGEVTVISDAQGKFSLRIPEEKKQSPVHFESLGYQSIYLTPQQIIEHPVIQLQDHPIQIQTITVLDKIPAIRVGSNDPGIHLKNSANGQPRLNTLYGSDFIKQVQLLPGVQADDDLNAQIKIRGSEGNESLILMDGIPIYRADHFYGIFSTTNANYLSNGSLYKNALPAQYGGRTGGLLTMNSIESVNKWHGSAEVDLLTASLAIFTPITDNISWNLGARTSYLNAAELNSFDLTQPNSDFYRNNNRTISRSEIIQTDPNFNFHDFNSKIRFQPSNKLTLDLNFFTSSDELSNNYDIIYSSQINRETATSKEIYRNSDTWNNLGTSLNLNWQLANHWSLQGSSHYASYSNQTDIRSLLMIDLPNQLINSGFSNLQQGEISTTGTFLYLQNQTNKQTAKIGIDYKFSEARYLFTEDDIDLLNGYHQANEYTLFTEKTWQINNTSFMLGGRGTYYSITDQIYLDPKLQINHQLSEAFQLKGSLHYAHQYTRELNYENRLGQSNSYLLMADGQQYPVGTSLQYMLGINVKEAGWNVDLEFYSKNLDGVLEYSLQMPGFDPKLGFNRSRSYRVLNGRGKVIGLDVLLTKSIKNYTGWIGYTLSKSTRQFKEIRRNVPFPAENDRRHQFKWVNTLKVGRFSLFANYIYSSGKPYLAINELPGEIDRRQLDSRAYLTNLPSYQRLDMGLDYHFVLLAKKATLGLSCFNITDHNNVKYLQYIFSVPVDESPGRQVNTILGTETSLLGRTPNLRFRIDF